MGEVRTPLKLTEEYYRILQEVGDDLKRVIAEQGVTQRELCDRSGLKIGVVRGIIHGDNSSVSLADIVQLYRVLNLQCRFFSGRDFEPIGPGTQKNTEPKVGYVRSDGKLSISLIDEQGQFLTLDAIETNAIKAVMEKVKKKSIAMRVLGIGRTTIYRKLGLTK